MYFFLGSLHSYHACFPLFHFLRCCFLFIFLAGADYTWEEEFSCVCVCVCVCLWTLRKRKFVWSCSSASTTGINIGRLFHRIDHFIKLTQYLLLLARDKKGKASSEFSFHFQRTKPNQTTNVLRPFNIYIERWIK